MICVIMCEEEEEEIWKRKRRRSIWHIMEFTELERNAKSQMRESIHKVVGHEEEEKDCGGGEEEEDEEEDSLPPRRNRLSISRC